MDRQSASHYLGRQQSLFFSFIAFLFSASLGIGYAQTPGITTGPFARTDRIDTELKRGVSTKADVERVLGKPNGRGGALMPPSQTKPGDVWVYYNAQSGAPRMSGSRPIKVEVDARHQMVMIFFEGDIFDGYMWFLHTAQSGGGEK